LLDELFALRLKSPLQFGFGVDEQLDVGRERIDLFFLAQVAQVRLGAFGVG